MCDPFLTRPFLVFLNHAMSIVCEVVSQLFSLHMMRRRGGGGGAGRRSNLSTHTLLGEPLKNRKHRLFFDGVLKAPGRNVHSDNSHTAGFLSTYLGLNGEHRNYDTPPK